MTALCFCGCRRPGTKWHHVVYQQELRRLARSDNRGSKLAVEREFNALRSDVRGMVLVDDTPGGCHQQHHGASRRYELARLPDAAYEFAAEVLGPDAAYEYLRRRYRGDDPRLDRLLLAA